MRVLLAFDNECTHFLGGVETWMLSLSKQLHNGGHHCELFFFQNGPPAHLRPKEIPVHVGSLADCLQIVARGRFDVVNAVTPDWGAGIGAVKFLPDPPKLILTNQVAHDVAWNSVNCDGLVAVSGSSAAEQKPCTDLPIEVIFNSVDVSRFTPAAELNSGPPIVGWVGRAEDYTQKRIDKLAGVAPLLHAAGIRLWIASPDGAEKIDPHDASLLTPLVERWEAIARERMPDFFRDIAMSGGLVLSTAAFEGLPLSLVEAQGCGCPVIGADVRGVNECVDPKHGGVLYPFDLPAEELARLVLATISDRECMALRREACRQYMCEIFSEERMAREYLRVYAHLPFPAAGGLTTWRARLSLSPLLHYKGYRTGRARAGRSCLEAAQELLRRGEPAAAAALRAARSFYPTQFLKPERWPLLLKSMGSGTR